VPWLLQPKTKAIVVGSLLAERDVEHEKRFGEVTFRIQTGVRSSQS
jgi:hypothetical protein